MCTRARSGGILEGLDGVTVMIGSTGIGRSTVACRVAFSEARVWLRRRARRSGRGRERRPGSCGPLNAVGRGRGIGVDELGQPGAQEMIVGVGEEQGVLQTGVGDLVATSVRNAADQSVGTEPPQVIGHPLGGDVLGPGAEEVREEGAQVTVGEPVGE